MWQDYVFAIGSGIMFFALLSLIDKKTRINKETCLTNASVLFIFAFAQHSLNLHLTAVLSFFSAAAWAFIAAKGTNDESTSNEVREGSKQPEHPQDGV